MSGDILQSAILSQLCFATTLEIIIHSSIIAYSYLPGQGLNLVLLL